MSLDHWSSRVRRRWVLPLLASLPVAAVVVGLGACLPVPLGDPEKSAVDPRLAGVWGSEMDEEGGDCLVVVPFDARAYLVRGVKVVRVGDPEGDWEWEVQPKGLYKAWLTRIKEATFINLVALHPHAGGDPKPDSFIVARLNILNDNKVIAHGVDHDFPALRTLALLPGHIKHEEGAEGRAPTPDEARALLHKVVSENLANEKLYGEDLDVTYERITDKAMMRAILEEFGED